MSVNINKVKEVVSFYNDNGLMETCKQFNLKESSVLRYLRMAKNDFNLNVKTDNEEENILDSGVKIFGSKEEKKSFETFRNKQEYKEEGNEATVNFIHEGHITSIEELLADRNVDLSVWNVDRHQLKQWECAMKLIDATYSDTGKLLHKTSTPTTVPLYGITAWLSKIKPDVQIVPVLKPVLFLVDENNCDFVEKHDNKFKTTLIFSDSQIGFLKNQNSGELKPFHDRKVLDVIMKILKLEQPDEIIINGDMLDCTEASKYAKKDSFYFTLQPAINEFGWLLSQIRSLCPNSKMVYMLGNHEIRIDRVMNEHMVYAYQLKPYRDKERVMSFNNLLNLNDLNIELIEQYPGGEYWINNNLKVKHGDVVNPKKELDITDVSVIMSHVHKIETQTKTKHGREGASAISVFTTGCTCKIDGTVPGNTMYPNWQQGFNFVESSENRFNHKSIHIINGKCIWKDMLIEGDDYSDKIKDILNV